MSFRNLFSGRFLAGALALTLVFAAGSLSAKPASKDKDSQKAFLGVYLKDVDRDTEEALGLSSRQGAVVEDVVEDGPAEKAGIRAEDVIVVFDGKKISSSGVLRELIADHSAGDRVKVVVSRDGKENSFTVKLDQGGPSWVDVEKIEKMIPKMGDAQTFSFSMPGFNRPRMGVQIMDLSQQLGDYFGAPDGNGALITEVVEDSPAQKAGLKAGDVIVRVGDDDIESTSDVYEALSDSKGGEKVNVEVLRKGQKKSFALALAEPERMFSGTWTPKAGDDDHVRIMRNYSSDNEDLKAQMEELQDELKELKDELRQMREDN